MVSSVWALLSLAISVMASPIASPVERPQPAVVFERSPAATSAQGTSWSSLECPGANMTTVTSNGQSFVVECGFDRPGDINMVYAANFASCIDACASYTGCVDVSYVSNGGGPCYMKSTISAPNLGNPNVWGARVASGSSGSVPHTSQPSMPMSSVIPTNPTSTQSTTATTHSSSAVSSSTSVPVSGKGKRGVAYTTASYAAAFDSSPLVTWGYNWGQSSGGLSSRFEYDPMLWNDSPGSVSAWNTNAQAAINAGAEYLLGFNEPDLGSQANMTPAQAASSWLKYMQPLASNSVKLVSPAVTNGGGEMGLQWLKEFFGNCTGCTVDAVALHWYSSDAPDLQNHIEQAYQDFNKPIWITEFELTGSTDAQVESFLQTILPWMDQTSYVERYSYFGAFTGYLLDTPSTLSDYGEVYANYV